MSINKLTELLFISDNLHSELSIFFLIRVIFLSDVKHYVVKMEFSEFIVC